MRAVEVCVLRRELVLSRTVRLGCIECSLSDWRTQHVLSWCHRLEMCGVNAGANAAEVIDLKASRDRTDECLVRDSVGHLRSTRHRDEAVALRPHPTQLPDPAAIAVDRDVAANAVPQ